MTKSKGNETIGLKKFALDMAVRGNSATYSPSSFGGAAQAPNPDVIAEAKRIYEWLISKK